MRSTFFHSLRRNQDMLAESLNLDQNDDVVTRSFTALGRSCALYFVEGMASGQRMSDSVLRPLLRAQEELSGRQALEAVTRRLIEAPEVKTEKQPYAAVQQLMRGQTLVLIDTVDEAVLVDLRGYIRRPVSIPQTENVVIGPHEAFTEPLRDNLTLLHRMLPTPRLICKLGQVGTRISTQTAVCYLEGICPQETVDEVQRRLEASAIDHVLTVGELSQLIEDDPFAPLPQVVSTERPDRAVSFLLEGQAVILIDGSPRCLAMPVSFWHLFHAPDDSYMRWMYGTFMRVVRAVGAVLDGYTRDTPKVIEQNFPVFCTGTWAQDSSVRTYVFQWRCPIEIGQVTIHNGDIVFGDIDGVLIIPKEIAPEVLEKALEKASTEKTMRKAIENGMLVTEAFAKFGVL